MPEEQAGVIAGLAGVILAGGKSSRFGSNKALAQHQGQPLIQRIADQLAPLFAERLLVTHQPEAYAFLDWPATSDRFPGCGPLAGIHAALSAIESDRAFVCACDMPLIDQNLVRFLCRLDPTAQVVVPWLPEGPEPLHAVYHKSILPRIEESLRLDQRRVNRLFAGLSVRKVDLNEILTVVPNCTSFQNVNHRHELAALKGDES